MRLYPNIASFADHKAMCEDAVAKGMYRNDRRVFLPGMGWFNDWYWKPGGPEAGKHMLCREIGNPFLSIHYWRDWADKRPPIEIVCPDGAVWCIDRKSSNGDGWQVTGEWPNITANPSIDTGDYHGFLRDGEFTPDISGKTWPIPNIGPDYGPKGV